MNESFEWDEAKAAENYVKHGVSFETAIRSSGIPLVSNGWMIARTTAKSVSS
jgi:uncharacterized DUF497 family protein